MHKVESRKNCEKRCVIWFLVYEDLYWYFEVFAERLSNDLIFLVQDTKLDINRYRDHRRAL